MTMHTFLLSGPISLSVRLGHGNLLVRTADGLTDATVELGAGPGDDDMLARAAVELSGTTLTVHAPRQGGLADLIAPWRGKGEHAIDVVVVVPTGTAVKAATFTAPITVTGRCGAGDIATGSGSISLDEVDGDLVLRYGSAESSVRLVTGSARVRSGTGSAHFGEVQGDLECGCGSGALEAGIVHGATRSRSGSGEAHLGAVYGDVDLASGSGPMSIGLPEGVTARLDVTTGSGSVNSELPVEDEPASRKGAITVRARTGSGDVRLFRAA